MGRAVCSRLDSYGTTNQNSTLTSCLRLHHQGILCHVTVFLTLAYAQDCLTAAVGGPFLPASLRESRPRNESPVLECQRPDALGPLQPGGGTCLPQRKGPPITSPQMDVRLLGQCTKLVRNEYPNKGTGTKNCLSNAKLCFWQEGCQPARRQNQHQGW